MKKILHLLILLPVLFNGCATTPSVSFITTVSAQANTVALNLALNNPAERKQIASYEFAAASAARSLSGGQVLTPDEFNEYVSSFFPEAATYADLAVVITGVYSTYYPQIQGDPKLALDVLEAIATGVEQSAKAIMDNPSSTQTW